MHRDDFITHTLVYVRGACVEWNRHAAQFADVYGIEFEMFVQRTHTVAYRYLRGQIALDGTCSDFECDLALRMHRLFHDHAPT